MTALLTPALVGAGTLVVPGQAAADPCCSKNFSTNANPSRVGPFLLATANRRPAIVSERDADYARRRVIRQLERLGHKVTLQPLGEAA